MLSIRGMTIDELTELVIGCAMAVHTAFGLVDGRLIVEVKAVDRLHPVHQAQVITYLKLTGFPAGLLLNFNATSLRGGLRRIDHPEIHAQKRAARKA
jgi:hypothetical protein